ncbi:alpha/beta fold hydrolase [Pontibacillus yanchengensis]|uniref:Alpha/beta fold hydrolase n=2 Tax=Pontibacillus yanchengensis TaxID=462910 RepID=A0ACC7VHP6_9BACI|nr:alpha/beta fold hydrolase [Pontibacillus yanchengensis]MYL33621.1 alpha/beta fold hydrolase [Pontibacillus yanchengensis]MYL54135.1 alpha/beta fold hydrolase [Pontibacillus yanchengensis]
MWKQQLVETNRGTFEVFVKGSGEPLCITHLCTEFNKNGYDFAEQFSNHFQVFLVNVKEAGNSSKVESEEELSMEETVKDLEAIREHLNLTSWAFAGNSTGGMLGLTYAVHFPNSLTKMLVGGAAASNDYKDHPDSIYSQKNEHFTKIQEILETLNATGSQLEEKAQAEKEWTLLSLFRPDLYTYYYASSSNNAQIVPKRLNYYISKELPTYCVRQSLHDVQVPTYIYCGQFDTQCPVQYSQEIFNRLPNSALYIFQESNHVPYLEEKPRFYDLVIDFEKLAS